MIDKSKYTEQKSGDLGIRWEIVANEKNGMKFTKDSPDNVKQGYYVGMKELPGLEGKTFKVHSIQTVGKDGTLGDTYALAGGTVIDDKFSEIRIGSFVGIEYLGRTFKKGYEKSPAWTQTNSYHNWFVGVQNSAPTYEQTQAKSGIAVTPVAQETKQPVANGTGGMQPNTDFIQADDEVPF